MACQVTLTILTCVDQPKYAVPDAYVHQIFSTAGSSEFSEERSLLLQTQERAHSSAWTLLHPASGSTDPVLSLELGRNITVYQGSGPSKQALTRLKKEKLFSSKRSFQHSGQTYSWRREALKQRHEEFKLVLTREDEVGGPKVPRDQRRMVAEVRITSAALSQLLVYQLGDLPMPLLVMTAMVQDFERRQRQASVPFTKYKRAGPFA